MESSVEDRTLAEGNEGHSKSSCFMSSNGAASRWESARSAWLAQDSGWDLSGARPLSTLLKMATAQAHTDVLRPAVVNQLITGQIALAMHIRYLMMLYDIYDAMENALAHHADHPLLASIHNPSILVRTQGISDDINHLLKLQPHEDWTAHPLAKSYRSCPPSALVEYIERLRCLDMESGQFPQGQVKYIYPAPAASPYLLLSHAYVRYMGDLNGGQIIKESVAKAYDLEEGTSDGLRFYRFETEDGQEASPAELSKLASWFRKGIDIVGNQILPEERAGLLQEANHAFELNIRLFSSFSEGIDSTSLTPHTTHIPRIPSPSLEGYAKAAAYMPATKISRQVNLRKTLPSISQSTPIQLLFVLAALAPIAVIVRSLLSTYVSAS